MSIRPTTGALMLITLFCAITFPVGVPVAMAQVEGIPTRIAVAAAVVFVALWLISVAVRWRAGGNGTLGLLTRRVLVSTVLLVTLGVGAAALRSRLDADAPDGFETDELGVLLLGFAILTFVVVAMLLSAVRAGAHRVAAR